MENLPWSIISWNSSSYRECGDAFACCIFSVTFDCVCWEFILLDFVHFSFRYAILWGRSQQFHNNVYMRCSIAAYSPFFWFFWMFINIIFILEAYLFLFTFGEEVWNSAVPALTGHTQTISMIKNWFCARCRSNAVFGLLCYSMCNELDVLWKCFCP